jgi:hypothetical protein
MDRCHMDTGTHSRSRPRRQFFIFRRFGTSISIGSRRLVSRWEFRCEVYFSPRRWLRCWFMAVVFVSNVVCFITTALLFVSSILAIGSSTTWIQCMGLQHQVVSTTALCGNTSLFVSTQQLRCEVWLCSCSFDAFMVSRHTAEAQSSTWLVVGGRSKGPARASLDGVGVQPPRRWTNRPKVMAALRSDASPARRGIGIQLPAHSYGRHLHDSTRPAGLAV